MVAVRSICLTMAALAVLACHEPSGPPAGKAPDALKALPRALTTSERGIIAGNNRFALALFRDLGARQPKGNLFISPLSASMALGMTMNGAAGATRDAFRTTLGFDSLPMADIDGAYQSLIALLRGVDPGVDFRLANSIWYRSGVQVETGFVDATSRFFGAQVQELDFNDPSAPGTINDWVNRSTNGKIPTIVDGIPPLTVMYLINAVYFKGSWRDRFDPAATQLAPFDPGEGSTATVWMMRREGAFAYREDTADIVVEMLYGNAAFVMTVLLPRPGRDVNDALAGLTPERWSEVTAPGREVDGSIALPRFTMGDEHVLNAPLQALGLEEAFECNVADFTAMSSALGRELCIDKVLQKTFVNVNEEGTEAAAVTSVSMRVTSLPARVDVRVDRPFIFAIRERFSGTILFIGRIVRPPS
jgi:serine protease inhibitor